MTKHDSNPCMFDNHGNRVGQWLPRMQSPEFLRESIARNERTSECWAELKDRQQRVQAAFAALAAHGVGGNDAPHR